MKVLIDAGHGENTPGKRSPDGKFREYLWNREVADLVVATLCRLGIDAEFVVTEKADVPLKERVKRINGFCEAYSPKEVLLVSIHSNASGNGTSWGTARGFSCYTSKGLTRSDELAECMYDSFTQAFPERVIRKDMSDGDRDWEEDFYILKNTKCPAVLLENFFYDNEEECRWLLQETTKLRISRAIVNGLTEYLSLVF